MTEITIWSHFSDEEWTGEVPVAPGGDDDLTLEFIFRWFNRVETHDAARLEAAGYNLPSLPAHDTVAFDGRTFLVDTVGFSEITDSPAA